MEKIKEKFQEKFQKWLDNFCLRGNCSSVRAGSKYFTRYHTMKSPYKYSFMQISSFQSSIVVI